MSDKTSKYMVICQQVNRPDGPPVRMGKTVELTDDERDRLGPTAVAPVGSDGAKLCQLRLENPTLPYDQVLAQFHAGRRPGGESAWDGGPHGPLEAEAGATTDGQPAATEKPAANGSKAAWKAYAIGQGMDEADAEAASRDELAEKYKG